MLKKISLAVLVLAAAFSMNAYAAPDRLNRWELGVTGGGAFNDNNIDDTGFIQLAADYGVTNYIAVGVSGGWQEADTAGDAESVGNGWVLFDIIVRNPDLHEQLVPYGVLGLGVVGSYATDENGSLNNGDDVDDTAFAWKLGAGLDWFINEHWILNLEFAYFDANTDLPGTSVADDDISFWTLGAGLKYLF